MGEDGEGDEEVAPATGTVVDSVTGGGTEGLTCVAETVKAVDEDGDVEETVPVAGLPRDVVAVGIEGEAEATGV